jgi:diguanylate cyclase (GGDEF)-like protein
MPQFLRDEPAEAVLNSLAEALDRVDIGILLLDVDMRVRFLNSRQIEIFNLPPALLAAGPAFRDLLDHAGVRSWFAVPAADLPAYLDQREAGVRAGSVPRIHIDLRDGRRLLFACEVCADGGRILTYADVSHELRPETLDAMEQINAELRFNNETMADHAAHLAALAESTDESARKVEEARRALEHEIVERGQLEEQLRRIATTDGLTGALTRAGFLAASQSVLERGAMPGRGRALLMLDVDHFKSINDRYGHAGGDIALKHLVAAVGNQTRRGDLLGRLGGEEFAILLPSIPPEEAERLAERLVAHVAGNPVTYGDMSIDMTVSIGLTVATATDRSIEQIIARADGALYRAKGGGRNRVVVDRQVEAPAPREVPPDPSTGSAPPGNDFPNRDFSGQHSPESAFS